MPVGIVGWQKSLIVRDSEKEAMMTEEEELKASRKRGEVAAQVAKNHQDSHVTHEYLLDLMESRAMMHDLAKGGHREAAYQEAYLKGFLSQWD